MPQWTARHVLVGFNPCCLGSGCSADGAAVRLDADSRFQSLLSWIRLLGCGRRCLIRMAAQRFQSLLSWIRLLGTVPRPGVDTCVGVSILVVLDQAARPADSSCVSDCNVAVSILVVLDQAARPRAALRSHDSAVRFQSLLSWIRLLGLTAVAGRRLGQYEFQSLLSWIRLLGT